MPPSIACPPRIHPRFRDQLKLHKSHRWRLKPHFQAGDPCYVDRNESYSVASLPDELKDKKLMQVVTTQVSGSRLHFTAYPRLRALCNVKNHSASAFAA